MSQQSRIAIQQQQQQMKIISFLLLIHLWCMFYSGADKRKHFMHNDEISILKMNVRISSEQI